MYRWWQSSQYHSFLMERNNLMKLLAHSAVILHIVISDAINCQFSPQTASIFSFVINCEWTASVVLRLTVILDLTVEHSEDLKGPAVAVKTRQNQNLVNLTQDRNCSTSRILYWPKRDELGALSLSGQFSLYVHYVSVPGTQFQSSSCSGWSVETPHHQSLLKKDSADTLRVVKVLGRAVAVSALSLALSPAAPAHVDTSSSESHYSEPQAGGKPQDETRRASSSQSCCRTRGADITRPRGSIITKCVKCVWVCDGMFDSGIEASGQTEVVS